MKKLLFILLAALVAAPAAQAAEAEKALAFYKKQAQVLTVKPSREERAFAKALADNLGTWTRQNPSNAALSEALLLQAKLYVRAEENARALVTLFQLKKCFPAANASVLTPLFNEAVNAVNADKRQEAAALFAAPLPAETKTDITTTP